MNRKTGVSSVVIRPTKKQKEQRKQRIKQEAKQYKRSVGVLLGQYIYRCTNCKNRIRMAEDIKERRILCTKCNAGVFAPAAK